MTSSLAKIQIPSYDSMRLIKWAVMLSSFLKHFELSISAFIFNISLGSKASFSQDNRTLARPTLLESLHLISSSDKISLFLCDS